MRFHENLVSSFIPDFVEIQRKSFKALLKKGLIKELSNRNPITNGTHYFSSVDFALQNNHDLELFFYPQYYQLNRPECTPTEAILKSKSYSCKLYVPAQLTNRQTNEIKLQWVLLGHLPLMTKRGHFIINGCPRVVVNQLVRSPGIYYQELIDVKKRKTYYADLISFRGTWLRFLIDKKRRVWARMKKTPKISALVFLQALGFTRDQIKTGIRFSDFLKNSYLKENHPDTKEEALVSLYEKSHPTFQLKTEKSQVTPVMGQNFLFRKFMNPRTYNLSLLGRMRLNKKFGLLISDNQLTLTRDDIFCAINYLINLKHGLYSVDDIDHLKNRRVKASGELIQNQLNTGLIRLEKTIREKMKKVNTGTFGLTIHSLITTKPINGALREFFGSSPLSQYLDQTNPLAEITHKRRVSSLGPGGISRETAGMALRGIHPTHYGRICPIETPEGRNAGLVNSITIHARISSHGFLKTPFYNVYQGQIQKQDSSIGDRRPIYFSAEQEERVKVAPGDLKASKLNFLPISKIPIRIGKEYHRVSREQVEYIAMSPIQMISIATSLIPFLEHDDANRALMGSNMQRQAVPIILPERPIVGTGLEGRVTADSGHVVQSKLGGYVSYASGKKIVLLSTFLTDFQNQNQNNSNTFKISNKKQKHALLSSNKTKTIDHLNKWKLNENIFVNKLHQTKERKTGVLRIQTYKNKALPSLIAMVTSPLRDTNRAEGDVTLLDVTLLGGGNAYPFLDYSYFVRSFDLVGKPFFRYKKVETNKIKDFRFLLKKKKANAQATLLRTGYGNQGKLRKGVKKKNKLYLFQKTVTPNNLTSHLSYKFFNLKVSSLINIIFISLYCNCNCNQESNYQEKMTLLAQRNFSSITSLCCKSFSSYLSFKKSIIHSLRSIYKNKTNDLTKTETKLLFLIMGPYITNGLQILTKKNGVLSDTPYKIVSDLPVKININIKKETYKSKIIGDKPLKLLLQNQLSKTLMRMRIRNKVLFVKTNINTRSDFRIPCSGNNEKFNKVFFYFNRFTNKIFVDLALNSKTGDQKLEFSFQKKSPEAWAKLILTNQRFVSKTYCQYGPKVKDTARPITKNVLKQKFCYALPLLTSPSAMYGNRLPLQKQSSPSAMYGNALPDKVTSPLRDTNKVTSNIAFEGIRDVTTAMLSSLSYREGDVKGDVRRGNQSPLLKQRGDAPTNIAYPLKGDSKQRGDASYCPYLLLGSNGYTIKPIQYSLQNYQRSNQDTCLSQRPSVLEGEWVQQGELLADCTASVSGDLSVGKNILVAYMPWEGYNFEDAILISERLVYDDIYTSIHIERYELEIRDTKFGIEQISQKIPNVNPSKILHLDEKGIGLSGAWVKEGDILIGKVTPIKKISLSPHEKLLYAILDKKIPTTRNTSLRVPKGVEGKIINVEILETKNIPPGITFDGPGCVHIYLAQKRKIQVGDKISGRHGNKGIVSKIIPRQDMPYLPNGTPIDMVLNPLGVPSRMNVGQVFEALLGLAGLYLNQSFKIPSFDETYGPEASRSIIYSKLYEARLKSGQKWLFDPNFPGKTRVFDGRTGQCFDQLVTVGQSYMLKLIHLVDDKIHARSTGPYSLVTQQPLGGRSKHGGQRLGEMEVWALEGFGAAYTLQELLTIKSDDVQGRHQVIKAILNPKEAPMTSRTPESFRVLIRELQSLCLDLDIYTTEKTGRVTSMDVMKIP